MEQPLPKDGACCLGSINLSEFVTNSFEEQATFDYTDFKKAIKIGIKTLDILIDENSERHALEAQKQTSLDYRNIGLGVMGYATMLLKMGIRYGSTEAKELTRNLFQFMFREAVVSSNEIAQESGTFPKYTDEVWDSEIMRKHFTDAEIEEFKIYGIRNCSLLSVAPCGTISTMISVSGGAEPEFAFKYTRRTEGLHGKEVSYDIYAPIAQEYMDKHNTTELPDYFVSSHEINWKDRVEVQAIMQESVDTAISSTVNLPKETSLEDVEALYLYAWKKGLKGITIFRDGCKKLGILTLDNKEEPEPQKPTDMSFGDTIQADDSLLGKKRKLTTGCGSLHCKAFFDPKTGNLLETYLSKGSTGGCHNFMVGLSRMISLSARKGATAEEIIDQLNSCGTCPSYAVRRATKKDTSEGASCPIAVGRALLEMQEEMHTAHGKAVLELSGASEDTEIKDTETKNNCCPECDNQVVYEGGCSTCKLCGWSKCS